MLAVVVVELRLELVLECCGHRQQLAAGAHEDVSDLMDAQYWLSAAGEPRPATHSLLSVREMLLLGLAEVSRTTHRCTAWAELLAALEVRIAVAAVAAVPGRNVAVDYSDRAHRGLQ
jgi:hypothetical protein